MITEYFQGGKQLADRNYQGYRLASKYHRRAVRHRYVKGYSARLRRHEV